MKKNEFTKLIVKKIKKTDKYRLQKVGKIKEMSFTRIETKVLRYNPYSEYTEFDITVNNKLSLTMKIYTDGTIEVY